MKKTGRKLYGYYPDEAAIIEVIKIKRRVRKGAEIKTGPYVIARELDMEGYRPQCGRHWTGQAVTNILRRLESEPKVKKQRPAKKTMLTAEDFLTKKQVDDCLLAGCRNEQEELVFRVLVDSGLRASEFCALQVRDLGLDGVKSQIDVRHGKGNKARSIVISKGLADLLRAHTATITGRKTNVFGIKYRQLHRLIAAIGKRVGIDYLHPHVLRHTYATILYDYTKDILFVAKQLGHKSVETTMIYAKLLSGKELTNVGIFDRLGQSEGTIPEVSETYSNLSEMTQGFAVAKA